MPTTAPDTLRTINRLTVLVLTGWTVLAAGSLAWNWQREHDAAMELAQNTARANFFKDQAFRFWASEKGGVYVELRPGSKTQPSPYLAHLPDRDISSTDGKHLTLMNPAFMLREMMDQYADLYGVRGRITGLKALNPNNLADPWEAEAIHAFERGVKEVSAVVDIQGEPHIRLMRPMVMTPDCMKCHAQLGYRVGDIRGGVGVAVPLREYLEIANKAHRVNLMTHGSLWLLGVVGIGVGYRRSRKYLQERQQTLAELALAAQVFENGLQGTLITDANGRILRVNHMFSEITGYSPEEAIGETPRLLKSDHQSPEFYQTMWQSLTAHGSWQGELWDRRKNGEAFAAWQSISSVRDSDGNITYYIGMLQDVTEQKRASERIQHLAHYDILTGLPNRQLFHDRLQHAVTRASRDQSALAVLFVDLDRFKYINDSLGHYAGDQVLRITAERLSSCVREADTVARLGGDEFTILIENVGQISEVERLVERLLQTLAEPITLAERDLFIGASIGIALFPRDGTAAETLLKNADTAMYRAKAGGRGRACFFDEAMSQATLRRIALTTALRYSIEREELVLYLQPQAGLAKQRIQGFEALLRWQSAEHGWVMPNDFIPLAEESGQIIAIGEWVLDNACREAMRWSSRADGPNIAVNVSAIQLLEKGFVDQVATILQQTGLPPGRLELEITESAVMDQIDQAVIALERLKRLGVCIAVDDFGTGYSSLSYLKRLPVDRLKIDRSFVKDLPDDTNDAALVRAIVAMAHSLGLETVAEGIETEAQRAFLAALGCDHYQGYYLSRPLPADEAAALLAATYGEL
jgi:diguanylate cyclase (GGDEF)-like protein/PAS domain S-box-containing protein